MKPSKKPRTGKPQVSCEAKRGDHDMTSSLEIVTGQDARRMIFASLNPPEPTNDLIELRRRR